MKDMKEKLLEIASRIHCPDSEGGKYAAGIKAEIEAFAESLGKIVPRIESVISWGQRMEPSPLTTIEFRLGNWKEGMSMHKSEKSGIYLGNGFVAVTEQELLRCDDDGHEQDRQS